MVQAQAKGHYLPKRTTSIVLNFSNVKWSFQMENQWKHRIDICRRTVGSPLLLLGAFHSPKIFLRSRYPTSILLWAPGILPFLLSGKNF